jgi:hypothetical protein
MNVQKLNDIPACRQAGSTDEPRWGALKLKLGFVAPMKDIFVPPQLLEADVVCSVFWCYSLLNWEAKIVNPIIRIEYR